MFFLENYLRFDLDFNSLQTSQIMSELGTVEEQLDVIQTNFNKHPGPPILTEGTEQPEQLSPELSNSNEISISSTDASTSSINSSFRLPNLVFPSVRNKPIADSNNIGLDAFLTGVQIFSCKLNFYIRST